MEFMVFKKGCCCFYIYWLINKLDPTLPQNQGQGESQQTRVQKK